MPVHIVADQTVTIGEKFVIDGDSPSQDFGVAFEDDGTTGYLYGLDFSLEDNPIVDALHIYDVDQVVDRNRPSQIQVVWSFDGLKAALLINNYTHAVFDFEAQRGYCRTALPAPAPTGFSSESHAWDDKVMELFR